MSDTYGPTSSGPFATFDPSLSCWKTSEATSLWALPMSSVTLPSWGGLHDGELSEHPTPEHLTNAPAYSSLPTPTGDDANNVTRASGSYHSLTRAVMELLPTPTARDHKGRNQRDDETCLHGAITALLSHDGKPSRDDRRPTPLSYGQERIPA